MSIEISFLPERMQIDVIHGFLRESYWSPGIRREVLERAIANSLVVGAFDGGKQIGFARVVTDYASFAWLCDVFVIPAYERKGIAKRMLRALLDHQRLQTVRRWCLATKDAHRLYEQFGFEPVDAKRWMEKRLPVTAWQEAH
ncbi:MAG: GNAT family N-acetyltransferase [Phycisphaerales bacterium]|nr:GNAT family N-acetyltransferase [Phycisphaerales bacterium]MCI0629170.1 GNAT family N-acetyltransferase [Phycisphaerales bacterium]MCI0675710.1 GNAT family N-acetyltransferase [Phycisphaerales bacterium]